VRVKLVINAWFLLWSISTACAQNSFAGNLGTQLPLRSSIVAEFNATSIMGVANGATFNSWTDAVNGIVASQSKSGQYPIYRADRLKGLASVEFDGSADLCLPSSNAAQAAIDSRSYTIFIVFRTLGPSSTGALIGAATGCCNEFWYYADGTSVGEYNVFTGIPYSGQSSFSTLGGTAFASGTYSSGQNGALQIIYVNGGAVMTSAITPPGTGGNRICIGVTNTSYYAKAEIFDIVIWRGPLTPPQYKLAQMWADDRYGQSHPWAGISAYNVFFGDSITAGVGVTSPAQTGPYLAAHTLGLLYGQWDNIAIGGITTSDMNKLAPTWVDPIPTTISRKINLVGFEWFNENSAFAPPKPFNDAQIYLQSRKLVSNVRTVWGTSTSYNGDPSLNRKSYDSAFDSVRKTNIDSYMPLHDNQAIGLTGPPSSYMTHPANWSDGVHFSASGYSFLAAAFVSAIQALR
jgi:hypothetical protein